MDTRTFPSKNVFGGVLVALLVVGIATLAMAQGPGQGRGGRQGFGDGEFGPEMRWERLAQHLDLSAEQTQTIAEIREKGRAKNLELRKEMMQLRHEKRGEMLKDDPATKTVLGLTTKIGELRTEMQINRMRGRLEVRKLLTPQQRDKMLLRGEGRGGRGGRRGSGEGHRGEFGKAGKLDKGGKSRGGCDQMCAGAGRGHARRGNE